MSLNELGNPIQRAITLANKAIDQFKKINHWRGLYLSYSLVIKLNDHLVSSQSSNKSSENNQVGAIDISTGANDVHV